MGKVETTARSERLFATSRLFEMKLLQVEKDQNEDETAFGSYYRRILCKRYTTRDECMKVIDFNRRNSSNIMSVDSGEVFVGGRYHSLVPILRYDLTPPHSLHFKSSSETECQKFMYPTKLVGEI